MFVSGVTAAPPAAPSHAAGAVPGAAAAAAPAADAVAVLKAVAAVKETLKPVSGSLEFSVDQDSGRTIVRVVDAETQQVIRQIPSEEMVKIARVMTRLEGLLLHKRA